MMGVIVGIIVMMVVALVLTGIAAFIIISCRGNAITVAIVCFTDIACWCNYVC